MTLWSLLLLVALGLCANQAYFVTAAVLKYTEDGTKFQFTNLLNISDLLQQQQCGICDFMTLKDIKFNNSFMEKKKCRVTWSGQNENFPLNSQLVDIRKAITLTVENCETSLLHEEFLDIKFDTASNTKIPFRLIVTFSSVGQNLTATPTLTALYAPPPVSTYPVPKTLQVQERITLDDGEMIVDVSSAKDNYKPSFVIGVIGVNVANTVVTVKMTSDPAEGCSESMLKLSGTAIDQTGNKAYKMCELTPTYTCFDMIPTKSFGKLSYYVTIACPPLQVERRGVGRQLTSAVTSAVKTLIKRTFEVRNSNDAHGGGRNVVQSDHLLALNGQQNAGTALLQTDLTEPCISGRDADTTFEVFDANVRTKVNCNNENWDQKYVFKGSDVCFQLNYPNIEYGAVFGLDNRVQNWTSQVPSCVNCSMYTTTPLPLMHGVFLCKDKFNSCIAPRQHHSVGTNSQATTLFSGGTSPQYRDSSCSKNIYSALDFGYQCCSESGIHVASYSTTQNGPQDQHTELAKRYCKPAPGVYPKLERVVLRVSNTKKQIIAPALNVFIFNPHVALNYVLGNYIPPDKNRPGFAAQQDTKVDIECVPSSYDVLFPTSSQNAPTYNLAYKYGSGLKACDALKRQLHICNQLQCVNAKCYMWDINKKNYNSTEGFDSPGNFKCKDVTECYQHIDHTKCHPVETEHVNKTGGFKVKWWYDKSIFYGKAHQSTQMFGFGPRFCKTVTSNATDDAHKQIQQAVANCTNELFKNELYDDLVSPDLDNSARDAIRNQLVSIVQQYAKYGPGLKAQELVLIQDTQNGPVTAGYAGFNVTAHSRHLNPKSLQHDYGKYSTYKTMKWAWTHFQEDATNWMTGADRFGISKDTLTFQDTWIQDTTFDRSLFQQNNLQKYKSAGAKFMTLLCSTRLATWFAGEDAMQMSWHKTTTANSVTQNLKRLESNSHLQSLATRLLSISYGSNGSEWLATVNCSAEGTKTDTEKLDYIINQQKAKYYATAMYNATTLGQGKNDLNFFMRKLSYDSRTCKGFTPESSDISDIKVWPVRTIPEFRPLITPIYCQQQDTMIKLGIESDLSRHSHPNTDSWFYLYVKICDNTIHGDGTKRGLRGLGTYNIQSASANTTSWKSGTPYNKDGLLRTYNSSTDKTCSYIFPYMKNYRPEIVKGEDSNQFNKVLDDKSVSDISQMMTKDEHTNARTMKFMSEIYLGPALYFDGRVNLEITIRVADCYNTSSAGCRYYDSVVENTQWTVVPRKMDAQYQAVNLAANLITSDKVPGYKSLLPTAELPSSMKPNSTKICRAVKILNKTTVFTTQATCDKCGSNSKNSDTYTAMGHKDTICTNDDHCATDELCLDNAVVRSRYSVSKASLTPKTRGGIVYGYPKYLKEYWQQAFSACPVEHLTKEGNCSGTLKLLKVVNEALDITDFKIFDQISTGITVKNALVHRLVNGTGWATNFNEYEDWKMTVTMEKLGIAVDKCPSADATEVSQPVAESDAVSTDYKRSILPFNQSFVAAQGLMAVEEFDSTVWPTMNEKWKQLNYTMTSQRTTQCESYPMAKWNGVASNWLKMPAKNIKLPYVSGKQGTPITRTANGQVLKSRVTSRQGTGVDVQCFDLFRSSQMTFQAKVQTHQVVALSVNVECMKSANKTNCNEYLRNNVLELKVSQNKKTQWGQKYDKNGKVLNTNFYDTNSIQRHEKKFASTNYNTEIFGTVDALFSYDNNSLAQTKAIVNHVTSRHVEVCIKGKPSNEVSEREVAVITTWYIIDNSLNKTNPKRLITQSVATRLVLLPELPFTSPSHVLRSKLLSEAYAQKNSLMVSDKVNQGRTNMLTNGDTSHKAISVGINSFVNIKFYLGFDEKQSSNAKADYFLITFVQCKPRTDSVTQKQIQDADVNDMLFCTTNIDVDHTKVSLMHNKATTRKEFNGNTKTTATTDKAYWLHPKTKETLLQSSCFSTSNDRQNVTVEYHMTSDRMRSNPKDVPKGDMFLVKASELDNIWVAVLESHNIALRISAVQMDDDNAVEKFAIIKAHADLWKKFMYQIISPFAHRSNVLSIEILAQAQETQELAFIHEPREQSVTVNQLMTDGVDIKLCSSNTANHGLLYLMFLAFRHDISTGYPSKKTVVGGLDNYNDDDTVCKTQPGTAKIELQNYLYVEKNTLSKNAFLYKKEVGDTRTDCTKNTLEAATCKTRCYENIDHASMCPGDTADQTYTGHHPASMFASAPPAYDKARESCGAFYFNSENQECATVTLKMHKNQILSPGVSWTGAKILLGLISEPDYKGKAQVDSQIQVSQKHATTTLTIEMPKLVPQVLVDMSFTDPVPSNSPCSVYTTQTSGSHYNTTVLSSCLSASLDLRNNEVATKHIGIASLQYIKAIGQQRQDSVVSFALKMNHVAKTASRNTIYRNDEAIQCSVLTKASKDPSRPIDVVALQTKNVDTVCELDTNGTFRLWFLVLETIDKDLFSIKWDRTRPKGSGADIATFDLTEITTEEFEKFKIGYTASHDRPDVTYTNNITSVQYTIHSPLQTPEHVHSSNLSWWSLRGLLDEELPTLHNGIKYVETAGELVLKADIKFDFPDKFEQYDQWIFVTYKEEVHAGKKAGQTCNCSIGVTSQNQGNVIHINEEDYLKVPTDKPMMIADGTRYYDISRNPAFAAEVKQLEDSTHQAPYKGVYIPVRVLDGSGKASVKFSCTSKSNEVNNGQIFDLIAHFVSPKAGVSIPFYSTLSTTVSIRWSDTRSQDNYKPLNTYDGPAMHVTQALTAIDDRYVFQSNVFDELTLIGKASVQVEGVAHESTQVQFFCVGECIPTEWARNPNLRKKDILDYTNAYRVNLDDMATVTLSGDSLSSELKKFANAEKSNMMPLNDFLNYTRSINGNGTYVDKLHVSGDASSLKANAPYDTYCTIFPCSTAVAFVDFQIQMAFNDLLLLKTYDGNKAVRQTSDSNEGTTDVFSFDLNMITLSKYCKKRYNGPPHCSSVYVTEKKQEVHIHYDRQSTIQVAMSTEVEFESRVSEVSIHQVKDGETLCNTAAISNCQIVDPKYYTILATLEFTTFYSHDSLRFISPTNKFDQWMDLKGSILTLDSPNTFDFNNGLTMNSTDGSTAFKSRWKVSYTGNWKGRMLTVKIEVYSHVLTTTSLNNKPLQLAKKGSNPLVSETIHVKVDEKKNNPPSYSCEFDKPEKCTMDADTTWKFNVAYKLPILKLSDLVKSSAKTEKLQIPLKTWYTASSESGSIWHDQNIAAVNNRDGGKFCVAVSPALETGTCSETSKTCHGFSNNITCTEDKDCAPANRDNLKDYKMLILDVTQREMKQPCWIINSTTDALNKLHNIPSCGIDGTLSDPAYFSWWSNFAEVVKVFSERTCTDDNNSELITDIYQRLFDNVTTNYVEWDSGLSTCLRNIEKALTHASLSTDAKAYIMKYTNPVFRHKIEVKDGKPMSTGVTTAKSSAVTGTSPLSNLKDKKAQASSGVSSFNRKSNSTSDNIFNAYDIFCRESSKFTTNTWVQWEMTVETFFEGDSSSRRLLSNTASSRSLLQSSQDKQSIEESDVVQTPIANVRRTDSSASSLGHVSSSSDVSSNFTNVSSHFTCVPQDDDGGGQNCVAGNCCQERTTMTNLRKTRWAITLIWTFLLLMVNLRSMMYLL